MTAKLSYVPASPDALDALTFTVTGEVPDQSQIVATGAVAGIKKSVVFTQGLLPDGTGPDAITLEIEDATEGDFTLDIYEYGDGVYAATTDPIYYFADEEYTYPDSDDLIEALEAALPGVAVSVTRDGPVLTLLFGGDYSGKKVVVTGDATGLTGGTPAVTITEVPAPGGPFVWGPVVFEEETWTVDVLTVDGEDSVLDAPLEIEITA